MKCLWQSPISTNTPSTNTSLLQVKRQIRLGIILPPRPPIPHKPKPIPRPIHNLKVLRPNLINHLLVPNHTPRPHSSDLPIHSMVLIPAPTPPAPHKRLHNLVGVRVELVDGSLLRHDVLDVLGGHLAQPLAHPVGAPAEAGHQAAVANGRVGAREREEVGEVGGGEGHVGGGLVFPRFGEREAVEAN
jgi:hypothetical protein